MNKKQLLPALLLGFALQASYAQSTAPKVIASTGGDGSSATHQLSWTIGEHIISTETSTNQVLTQGFHQTQLVVLNNITHAQPSIAVKAFPNPTSQYITVEIPSIPYESTFQLQVLDVAGKQLESLLFSSSNTIQQVDMETYPSGIYLLHIQDINKQPVSSIKVIKK